MLTLASALSFCLSLLERDVWRENATLVTQGYQNGRRGQTEMGESGFIRSHSDLKTGSAWVAAGGRVDGRDLFVTSRAAAAEPSPGVNYAWGGRLECGLGARPAVVVLSLFLKKGAELQSLSFVDRAW